MACGERIERQTRVWTWCKKWGIPYPCRRTETRIFYGYLFYQTRYVPSWFPFWQKREGCCELVIYEWKRAVAWNTPKPSGWTYHNPPIAMEFNSKLDTNGACLAGDLV